MSITLTQEEKSSLVCLEGAIHISCAAELKAVLLKAIEHGIETRVALGEVEDLDVTAVQLLWAAQREAKRSDAGFTLIGQPPQPVLDGLRDAGFESLQISQ